jgi:hypothetical protein
VARKVNKYNTELFKKALPELQNSMVEVYIDTENPKNFQEIAEVLKQAGSKKVKRLMAVILKNEYHELIYKREDGDVTAIKLMSGKSGNQNYRIYCREIFKEGKKVVLITPHIKKVQKNQQDQTIINIIQTIKTYDYEF